MDLPLNLQAIHSSLLSGSKLLAPLCPIIGLPIDQINFLSAELISVCVGQLVRQYASPRRLSGSWKMAFELAVGVLLLLFCYGADASMYVLQNLVAYCLMIALPARIAAPIVFAWSLGFLGSVHYHRYVTAYGIYKQDISGPLMIQTQKLTSLAYQLSDGWRLERGEHIQSANLRRHAVTKRPPLLHFLAYCYYYHSVIAGPFIFYNDYVNYVGNYGDTSKPLPDSSSHLRRIIGLALLHGVLTACVAPHFPYLLVVSQEFQLMPMSRRILYTMISFFMTRQKYYCAWAIAEASALSAGIGYEPHVAQSSATSTAGSAGRRSEWHATRNYDFFQIEMGSSIKMIIDAWNISTTYWLRETVYERAPSSCRTLAVFFVSAFWHGFYPGYYLFFLTFALFTFCARAVRRNFRPHFQVNPIASRGYDVFTTVVSSLATNYTMAPFILLELQTSLLFWKPFYFFPHFLALSILVTINLLNQSQSYSNSQSLSSISSSKTNSLERSSASSSSSTPSLDKATPNLSSTASSSSSNSVWGSSAAMQEMFWRHIASSSLSTVAGGGGDGVTLSSRMRQYCSNLQINTQQHFSARFNLDSIRRRI